MKTVHFVFSWLLLMCALWAQIPVSDTLMFTHGKLYYLHVVKPKQTLFSISRAYALKIDEIASVNNLSKKELQQGQKLLIPTVISPAKGKIILANDNVYSVDYHTVKKGETFYRIAKTYGISPTFLQLLNPDFNETSLKEGYLLLVAKPIKISQSTKLSLTGQSSTEEVVHVVKKGETLYAISRAYGVSVEELKKANSQLSEKLTEGQKIIIPHVKSITSCDCDQLFHKKNFVISLLLPIKPTPPMLTSPAKDAEWKTLPEFEYIEFYLGFKMALQDLDIHELKIKVKPILCYEDTTRLADILKKNRVNNSDAIISLLNEEQMKVLTDEVDNVPILYVELSKDEHWSQENPNVAQFITPINAQLNALAQALVKSFPEANFLLVHRSNLFFASATEQLATAFDEQQASYQIINAEKDGNEAVFSKLIVPAQNVMIVFESNEFFVKEFLRQLFDFNVKANEKYRITIVGLPGWINFDYIDFDFLEKFHAIFFGNQFVDYSNERVRQFVSQYQETYHADPGLKAFVGYDIARYVSKVLQKHGECFFNCFDHVEPDSCLSLQISLKRIPFKGWVNQGLQVYEMRNYYLWKK